MITASTPAAAPAARSGRPADPARIRHALRQDRVCQAIQLANRGVRRLGCRGSPTLGSTRLQRQAPAERGPGIPLTYNFELVVMLVGRRPVAE